MGLLLEEIRVHDSGIGCDGEGVDGYRYASIENVRELRYLDGSLEYRNNFSELLPIPQTQSTPPNPLSPIITHMQMAGTKCNRCLLFDVSGEHHHQKNHAPLCVKWLQ